MKSGFENSRYQTAASFESEQQEIFSKLWIFFCLRMMVDKPHQFVTRDIAGIPVVVQNVDGEPRAFRNVCLHRQSKLQIDDFGMRRLVCPYHGWSYGPAGEVIHIPLNDEYFGISPAEICNMKLERFHIAVIGQLVFINVDQDPLPIEEQFSPALIEQLASASNSFDREVLISKKTCDFDWKLIYENLRDSAHPQFLHKKTLTKDVEINLDPVPENVEEIAGRVPIISELSGGGRVHELVHDLTPSYAPKVERWGAEDAYFNWLLFPNTHIVSPNGGYMFSIEHHHPVAPGKTEITVYCVTAKVNGSLPASVLWEQMKGAQAVLDEDNSAMEGVQHVVARGPVNPVLGGGEHAIAALQNWIASRVKV
jgi:phenylpropionate dioxygenase-like ring-hydroxylating dioxygenase large terminal subunit